MYFVSVIYFEVSQFISMKKLDSNIKGLFGMQKSFFCSHFFLCKIELIPLKVLRNYCKIPTSQTSLKGRFF